MVGQTISHYRIVGQLGSGGMGTVYRAEDVRLGRPVALKFISEEMVDDAQAVQRLWSEARAASLLNHANICTIYDIGEHEGHPFIVMELLKGRTLRDQLASGPLKIHQIVDAGLEIADALHAAHSEGIVHRDIKPANIFVTERGHVKILDFGLAKLTATVAGSGSTRNASDPTVAGITLGTIAYMSPEQATGEQLDARTDLFSLGVVLYECATGRHPFPGKTSAVILSAILNRAPVAPIALNPEIPLRLQEVINNCLEKDRELRYQSAADLRADLKRVRRDIESGQARSVDATGAVAYQTGSGPTTPRSGVNVATPTDAAGTGAAATPPRRRTVLAGAVAVTLVVAAAVYALWPRPQPAAPPPRQETSVASTLSETTVRSRLSLAQASIEGRNYRAALAYAGEVLAIDSDNADAARIRDEARERLRRFDGFVADARARLEAGDLRGAARALEAARAIDSTAPTASELSAALSEQVRQRALLDRTEEARPRGTSGAAAGRARQAGEPSPPERTPPRDRPAARGGTAGVPPPPVAPKVDLPAPDTLAGRPASGAPLPAGEPVPPPPAASPPAASQPAASPPADAGNRVASAAPSSAGSGARPSDGASRSGESATQPPPATPDAPARSADADEAAIRRLTRSYARAIETKDVAAFRAMKPNLTRAEERRLEDGFRAVTSQQVELGVLSIDLRGDRATVVVKRRDRIEAGGRRQDVESQQTLSLARAGAEWVIVDIR